MGYFANLYLVEVSKASDEITEVKTTVYGGNLGGREAYFSWDEGDSDKYLPYSFADSTLFSDTDLQPLVGYPKIKQYPGGKSFLLDASFVPRTPSSDPVVVHFVLNKHYVPKRDGSVFEQPCTPSISKSNGKLIITYPVIGKAEIKFWIEPIPENQTLDTYDVEKLVRPDEPTASKRTLAINLFFVKFTWHFGAKN